MHRLKVVIPNRLVFACNLEKVHTYLGIILGEHWNPEVKYKDNINKTGPVIEINPKLPPIRSNSYSNDNWMKRYFTETSFTPDGRLVGIFREQSLEFPFGLVPCVGGEEFVFLPPATPLHYALSKRLVDHSGGKLFLSTVSEDPVYQIEYKKSLAYETALKMKKYMHENEIEENNDIYYDLNSCLVMQASSLTEDEIVDAANILQVSKLSVEETRIIKAFIANPVIGKEFDWDYSFKKENALKNQVEVPSKKRKPRPSYR